MKWILKAQPNECRFFASRNVIFYAQMDEKKSVIDSASECKEKQIAGWKNLKVKLFLIH